MLWIRHKFGAQATLTDYLQHLLPRRFIGNDQGTTLIHKLPPPFCGHPECKNLEILTHPVVIHSYWPEILHIIPSGNNDTAEAFVSNPYAAHQRTFTIKDDDETCVTYDLVGRILHNDGKDHWTTEMIVGTEIFTYDDLRLKGSLQPKAMDLSLIEVANMHTHLLIYNRRTESNRVSHLMLFHLQKKTKFNSIAFT